MGLLEKEEARDDLMDWLEDHDVPDAEGLAELEQAAQRHAAAESSQLSLFQPSPRQVRADPLRARLEAIDPDQLTPRQALEALYELRALRDAD